MSRRNWCPGAVCALMVFALGASGVWANEIEIGVKRDGGTYSAWIYGMAPGVTGVQMQKNGSGEWIAFQTAASGEFDVESQHFSSLAALNADIAGDYVVQITHAGGVSQYSFTIVPARAEQFPEVPILAEVGATVPAQQLFAWTWSGSADYKHVEYRGWNGAEGVQYAMMYSAADAGFGELSLLADFGSYVGDAKFQIAYGNDGRDLITRWSLRAGDEALFGAGEFHSYIASLDEARFQVVPEPTILALLSLGGLGLIRRRR